MLAAVCAESVVYQQLPPPVQKQVVALVQGGGKIAEIDRAEEDGKATFTFDVAKGGRTTGYTLDDQGVIQSMEVTLMELPFPVQRTIQAQSAQGTLSGIDKNFDDGKASYETTWKSKDGKDHTFTVAEDGKLESIQMALEETSPAMQATIKKEAGAAPIEEIAKSFDGADSYYEVTIKRDGVERTFDVAENGSLESRQVFLTELSPAVQATIQQNLGKGTLVEIDQVFDGKKNAFEVESTVNGKPYNFNVGPKGKFLGVDQ